MSRREARKHVFVLLFQMPFHKNYDAETLSESYINYIESLSLNHDSNEKPDESDSSYMIHTLSGIFENLRVIDTEIQKYLKDWQLNRIHKADLAILRYSIYELMNEFEIPVGAIINEAVELAKTFGTDESSSFVNGVLGQAVKEYRK
jgi:N utilization substance protein B